jgi:hypothetical protein
MKSARIFVLVGGLFFLVFSCLAYAGVPQRMNYQGKITTPAGALVDTTIQMVFTIYNSPTDGYNMWTETHPAVVVEKGIFNVILGMINPLDLDDFYFYDSLYLGVKVGADPEMTPRKQIVSSAYAITDGDWWEWEGDLYRFLGSVYIWPPEYLGAGAGEAGSQDGFAKLEVAADYMCAIWGYNFPYYYAAGESQYDLYGIIGDASSEDEAWRWGVGAFASGPGENYGLYGNAQGGYYGTSGGSPLQYDVSYGVYGGSYADYGDACGVWGDAYASGWSIGLAGFSWGGQTNFGAMTMAEAYLYASETGAQAAEVNIGLSAAAGEAEYYCAGVEALAFGGEYTYDCNGIYAYASGGEETETYAGYFDGDIFVYGNIYQPLASIQLDHPLYPESKYLQHSLVESPDMMSVYNGNVMLDATGQATVELPAYFEALNKDFRYQLTAIGAPGPNLYIAAKIVNNQFSIAGGEPGMEVSWQVTGIRNDPFAQANPIQVEVDKPVRRQGKYLHPEAYGLGKEYGTSYELRKKVEEQQQRIQEQRQRSKEQEQRMNEQREQRKLLGERRLK